VAKTTTAECHVDALSLLTGACGGQPEEEEARGDDEAVKEK
jgi:hypothetical protein